MITIRPASLADLAAMARLHAQGFAQPWDEAAIAGLMAAAGSFGMIAERSGRTEGFILIRVVADEAEILTIAVEARRLGTGSALLRAACEKAVQTGAISMFLEVAVDNVPAKALYEKHGFRPVGTRKAYYQGGDALVLKAALPLAFRMGNPEKTL